MSNAATMARTTRWRGAVLAALAFIAVPALAVHSGAAQSTASNTAQGVPNALQGFSQNRDQPVKIESTSLEVRDKDRIATFIGNVHLTQGDTVLRSKILVVYYDNPPAIPVAGGMKTEPQPGGGQQQIRKLEAKGGVIVTQKDQTATGDTGLFDMKTNTVTLNGNVVVTQGHNVITGDKLTVDLTTGVSKVESGGGRVKGLFVPGAQPSTPGATPGAPQNHAPSRPGGPMKLN